ncbi:nicotinate-nucleotide adenylyltransferase [Thermoactinomyces sp. DSM 45892]|uniref:nicotinate-nucleotide adenylyltransferase n=1 Tax=Thermoactinomyces sp. DSM 45892 TaxID=1882753 RepID=UPI00089964D5|nr:nicotinate-nucleotide adenylyltransferase [Thermoactinomyces sp. DSM 45892]SDZ24391.1 nicotinate-nucleotide adenylyltransferase [Thermoactinomyces sp. DSM 45892]
MRIGIMGGTFDPIHHGHLLIAEQAREGMNLDQVWFVPAGDPPHKRHKTITSAKHRLHMVQLATENHPCFQVKDIEIKRSGPSYTLLTIQEFTKQYPDAHFFLIMGEDMVKNLPEWYRIEKILQYVQIIGLHRPGTKADDIPNYIDKHVCWIEDVVEIRLSSTFVQKQVRLGKSVRYMVPDLVDQYIKEQGLYGS